MIQIFRKMKYAHYLFAISIVALGVTYYVVENRFCSPRSLCYILEAIFFFSLYATPTALVYSLFLPHDRKWFLWSLSLYAITVCFILIAPESDPSAFGPLSIRKEMVGLNLGFLYALLSACYLLWHFFLKKFWNEIA